MLGRLDSLGEDRPREAGWSWLSRLAVAWVCGLVLAAQWPGRYPFFIAGLLAFVAGLVSLRRGHRRGAQWAGLVAIAMVAGCWLVVHRDYIGVRDISRFVHDEPAIAQVRGVIASPPRDVLPGGGPFGGFDYQGPGTLFELSVDTIDAGNGFERVSGTLMVRLKEHDHRPKLGQRIEATGWLAAIGPTQNPGEFDYRAYLREQGVAGRLSLQRRGNWRALGPAPRYTFTGLRRAVGDGAAASMRLGMPDDSEAMSLLDALLLGRRTGDLDGLSESFRAVGLSHVLSISGAHLGILLLIVWALGRLCIGRPSVVTVLVLAVLVLFLLVVPWRTPIVRASIMAGVFCLGYGLGRRLTGIEMLSAAVLIVLVWRPMDVFSAGFQLSFGVVGAFLLFAQRVSAWLMPPPEAKVVHPSAWDLLIRWLIDFTSVSLVAFMVALPLVMYHFQIVSPLAVLLSMLAVVPLTLVLALGYLKILVGLLSPALGALLAVPLAWSGDTLSGLVVHAERWPGASFVLWTQPSVAWTLCAVAAVVTLLGGWFRERRIALGFTTLIVVGWAWGEQRPSSVMGGDDPPALAMNMFAVGDGSCYLLRSGDEVLMFDCGSQGYWRIGERSIVPALKRLGVRRIDMLMISHADLDHFVGVLDVVEHVEVGRVLVSSDLMREAQFAPDRAAGFLIESLRDAGFEPVVVEAGWEAALGVASLELLWPAPDYVSSLNNNNGLVLRVAVAGRVLLLNSDVQGEAIGRLLERPDALKADVTDLAHHGSFVEESPMWFEAVDPGWVLQSSGPRRLGQDRWHSLLHEAGVPRLWTYERGMVQLLIERDGAMQWSSHRDGSQ